MSAILSCAERPANFCGCSVTGSAGAAGRARPHTRSTRLRAVGTSLMPCGFSAASRRSISAMVCRRGSKPTAWPRDRCSASHSPMAPRATLETSISARLDLGARLHRIAAVDEQCRRLLGDDGEAGRAGKAGQPFETRRARRHVFALVLVGARHEIGVELGGRHQAPQLLDALGGGAALGLAFEGLEHGSLFKRLRRRGQFALPRTYNWRPLSAACAASASTIRRCGGAG